MASQLIQLSFDKIMQTRSYTVIVLGNQSKKFAIYVEPSVGKTLQLYLTEVETPRPLTHQLFHQILKGMDVRIKQVVIYDLQDTVYFAKIFIEQNRSDFRHILEVDVRPSDSLILALMDNAPIYCNQEVFNKAISVED